MSDPPDRHPPVPSRPSRQGAWAETGSARRFLQRAVPESWRFAHQTALDLVRRVEFLAWPGRADTFDRHFLRQAGGMLRPQGLTDLVNGASEQAGDLGARRELEERTARFVHLSRATVTAVLIELGERPVVTGPLQAMTYLLGQEPRLARAAAAWTACQGMGPIGDVLRFLPGYALVLLAASPNDTAERFLARDAFWNAVLKSG